MTNGKRDFWEWLAWRLPGKLVYWAAVRLLTAATAGKHSNTVVSELTGIEALNRWEEKP